MADHPRGRRLGIFLCWLLLALSPLAAQDAVNFDNDDWALIAGFETGLRLGSARPKWEVHNLNLYQRDRNFSRFSSGIGSAEVLRNFGKGQYLSLRVFFLGLRGSRNGGLYRLEYQKVWADKRLAPTVRLIQERLNVQETSTGERVLGTPRTRVRGGLLPKVLPNTRLAALFEVFPFQRPGNWREFRTYVGPVHQFTPSFRVALLHQFRYRDFTEQRRAVQNAVILVGTVEGVFSGVE